MRSTTAASARPCPSRARWRRRARSTATPRPRRIHSPAPSDCLSAANTRPPISTASGERNDGAERIGEQQDRRLRARAADRGAGQDQAEDRPGAGRPQESDRDAEQRGLHHDRRVAVARGLREAIAEGDEGRAKKSAARRESSATPKHGEHDERDRAAERVELHGPAAADGGERRDGGERQPPCRAAAAACCSRTAARCARTRTAGPAARRG